MTVQIDRLTTIPTPNPLEVEWEYNGDFWEIGYYLKIEDAEAEDGYRLGEWITLATVNLGCSLDPEADDTWKLVHQIGALMATAPRMKATLERVKTWMDEDPEAFSWEERSDVDRAIDAGAREAKFWTRDDNDD